MASTGSPLGADSMRNSGSCPTVAVMKDDPNLKLLTHVVAPSLFGIFVVIGVLGNCLVIAVILHNINMRNATNILIMSLATADLIFIICCVPFTAVTYASDGWPLGSGTCKMYQYMIYVTAYCSVYTLVLMAIDRYLAVVHPLHSGNLRTNRNAFVLVVLLWLVVMTGNLPLAINSDIVSGHRNEHGDCIYYCSYLPLLKFNGTISDHFDTLERNYVKDKQASKIYYLLFFIFGYILPLITIIGFYSRLIRELLCGRTARLSRSRQSAISKRRVTRLVVVIVIAFALCWLPIQIVFLIQHFHSRPPHNLFFRTLHIISNCLAYANSSLNPILYAFLSDNFRVAFRQLLFQEKRPPQLRPASNFMRLTQMTRSSHQRTSVKHDEDEHKVHIVTDL